tara:strand:- start:286 stop:459 length:174 start_codon:yes stop_codon:yes gene_type:complete
VEVLMATRFAGEKLPAGFLPPANQIGQGCEKKPVDQYPAPPKPTMYADYNNQGLNNG